MSQLPIECAWVRDNVPDIYDQHATSSLVERCERHLGSCDTCRVFVDAIMEGEALLFGQPASAEQFVLERVIRGARLAWLESLRGTPPTVRIGLARQDSHSWLLDDVAERYPLSSYSIGVSMRTAGNEDMLTLFDVVDTSIDLLASCFAPARTTEQWRSDAVLLTPTGDSIKASLAQQRSGRFVLRIADPLERLEPIELHLFGT